jgi:hypothetical protein
MRFRNSAQQLVLSLELWLAIPSYFEGYLVWAALAIRFNCSRIAVRTPSILARSLLMLFSQCSRSPPFDIWNLQRVIVSAAYLRKPLWFLAPWFRKSHFLGRVGFDPGATGGATDAADSLVRESS